MKPTHWDIQVLEARGISPGLSRWEDIKSLKLSLAKIVPLQWKQHRSTPVSGSIQLPNTAVLYVHNNSMYAYSGLKYIQVKHSPK